MTSHKFWLRVLNVYPREWGTVKQLYLFQFFQGAGIAFFFTSALARFLERFPITELAWVMIMSSVLLWIVGLLYTRLEHVMSFKSFNLAVIIFMAASVLLVWAGNYQFKQDWFIYLTLGWFYALYLLNNLQFWGIAALLFDLRQSKRLFAVISGGDIPAKAIGYSLALVFVPYTGAANLLIFGAGCMLLSLPFFNNLVRSNAPTLLHHSHKHASGKRPIRKIVENIATNSYIRRIAFISLITSVCVILITYGFYGEVTKANKTDVALASFIAFFYASLRVIAFITKMVFTSRLTASLGVRQSLFITPCAMVLLAVVIVLAGNLSSNQKIIFYLFGACSMVVDVLRTSLNSPVLLTLMQPLPTYERLRAHNIVKGIMDPFASLFAGMFLLGLVYTYGKVDLMLLCYVLIALGVLWLAGVVLVNRQYVQILIKTISNRYFSREEFNLHDDTIKEMVKDKMMTGTDQEVISILRMLNSEEDKVSNELIGQLLFHQSNPLKLEALRLLKESSDATRSKLEQLLKENTETTVRRETVRAITRLGKDDWNLDQYLEQQRELREAAIAGMLVNKDQNIRQKGQAALDQLLFSPETPDKVMLIAILESVKDEYHHPAHYKLIQNANPDIRIAAIDAIGKAAMKETLEALATQLPLHEKQVLAAFQRSGIKSLPILERELFSDALPPDRMEKLISLCGRIGGEEAARILLKLLESGTPYTSPIVKALHRSRFVAGPEELKLLEPIARAYIIYGVELLHMQQKLESENGDYAVLNRSIQLETQEIREVLLSLFGCLYDRDKITKVRHGLSAKQKDSVANAMEIIELTVKKDIGRQFNLMFESVELERRCNALRSLFTEKQFENIGHILERILSEKPILYFNWTKACSMYVSGKQGNIVEKDLFRKFMESENRLLKETALFAAANPKKVDL